MSAPSASGFFYRLRSKRFCLVFDSRSSFFAPNPLGNACYAGEVF